MPRIAMLSVYLLVLKRLRRDIRDSRNGGHCQWLRLKGCHVASGEWTSGEICSLHHMWVISSVMWAAASDESLKFGVQGATATN